MHRVEQQQSLIEQTVYPYSRLIRKFIPSGEIPEVKPIFSHYDTTARRNDKLPYHKIDWVKYNLLRIREEVKQWHEYYQQRKQF